MHVHTESWSSPTAMESKERMCRGFDVRHNQSWIAPMDRQYQGRISLEFRSIKARDIPPRSVSLIPINSFIFLRYLILQSLAASVFFFELRPTGAPPPISLISSLSFNSNYHLNHAFHSPPLSHCLPPRRHQPSLRLSHPNPRAPSKPRKHNPAT